jgi:hypothetical protein
MRYRLVGRSGLRVGGLLTGRYGTDRERPAVGGASLAYGNTCELIDDHRGRIDPLV